MLIKERKTTNPIIRCDSCDERPRIRSHSDAAFTPAHGLLSSGQHRMGDLSAYEFMDRMVWLTGNGQAPGACVDLCRDDGQKIAEDAVYNMHQRIRVCFAYKEMVDSDLIVHADEVFEIDSCNGVKTKNFRVSMKAMKETTISMKAMKTMEAVSAMKTMKAMKYDPKAVAKKRRNIFIALKTGWASPLAGPVENGRLRHLALGAPRELFRRGKPRC